MLGFADLWKVIEFLAGRISEGKKIEREQLTDSFNRVIETSYNDLEKIHSDYTTQLSKLRSNLRDKKLPPYELIEWLRTTGLQYRPKRDALATFHSEVKSFSEMPADPLSDDVKARFLWYLQSYAKEIVAYVECTTTHKDLSFYRDYEYELTRLLRLIEDEHRSSREKAMIAEQFYDADYVNDMNEELVKLCDKALPASWKRVTEQYRAMRSIVFKP